MRGYQSPTRALVNQNDAAMIENANVPRSRFLSSKTRKTTFDAGRLVPFLIDEILPGDHMKYDVTAFVRLSTPLFPLFDNQRIDTFFFFVPCRLVWRHWVNFMGEQAEPDASIDYTIPQVQGTGPQIVGGILDHMGIPYVTDLIDVGQAWQVNALPFRAYDLIWNQWFRDENLVDSVTVDTGDGPDDISHYTLRDRAKTHDYFTSALPWPQKFTAPTVSMGGFAPVLGIGGVNRAAGGGGGQNAYQTDGTAPVYVAAKQFSDSANDDKVLLKMQELSTGNFYPAVYADLSEATGVAINTFRQAFMVQTLLERDARGGTRYTEIIRSHFGVTSPDFRLQRPEYIGGGQTPLQITAIAQTVQADDAPLGALGGAGTAAGSHRASYAATEHGYIIGLINVRTEQSYQRGVPKLFSRSTRYDFYFPALAQLGEQAVYQKEIFATGDDDEDYTVFGYQERWQEYRTLTSDVTSVMRSGVPGTLDAWHLAQAYDDPPQLNEDFIKDNPDMARVLAAGDLSANQEYLADILIKREAIRPIPTYGTPAILGRF